MTKLTFRKVIAILTALVLAGLASPASATEVGPANVYKVKRVLYQEVRTGFGQSTTIKVVIKAKIKTYADGSARKYVYKTIVKAPKRINGERNANRKKIRGLKDVNVGVKNVITFDPPRSNYFWHDTLGLRKNAVTDGRLVCVPNEQCLVFIDTTVDVKYWEDLSLSIRTSL